jgi:small multidrug resistance pump
MNWIYLLLAIVFEVTGTSFLKLSSGFTKVWPAIGTVVLYILTFLFLGLAMKKIELSVAYAVWSGVGIILLALVSFFFFSEKFSLVKTLGIVFIIIGVVMVNLTTRH